VCCASHAGSFTSGQVGGSLKLAYYLCCCQMNEDSIASTFSLWYYLSTSRLVWTSSFVPLAMTPFVLSLLLFWSFVELCSFIDLFIGLSFCGRICVVLLPACIFSAKPVLYVCDLL